MNVVTKQVNTLPPPATISLHAAQRYAKRVLDDASISPDLVINYLYTAYGRELDAAVAAGASRLRVGGASFILDANVVVTVLTGGNGAGGKDG